MTSKTDGVRVRRVYTAYMAITDDRVRRFRHPAIDVLRRYFTLYVRKHLYGQVLPERVQLSAPRWSDQLECVVYTAVCYWVRDKRRKLLRSAG